MIGAFHSGRVSAGDVVFGVIAGVDARVRFITSFSGRGSMRQRVVFSTGAYSLLSAVLILGSTSRICVHGQLVTPTSP